MVNSEDTEIIDKEGLEAMVFPRGSNPDLSPLHIICCNDTCSFTWTGAEHINQVIVHLFIYHRYKKTY